MRSLNTEKVWQACLNDPYFLKQIPEGAPRVFMHEMILLLPEALADFLEKPASPRTVAEAKIIFMRSAIEHGLMEKLINELLKKSGIDDEGASARKMLEAFMRDADTLSEALQSIETLEDPTTYPSILKLLETRPYTIIYSKS